MNIHLRNGRALSFDELAHLVRTSIHGLHAWDKVVKQLMSATVDDMIARGKVPIKVADAFDDIGQFCLKLGQDIMQERTRRGMPMPPGPDD